MTIKINNLELTDDQYWELMQCLEEKSDKLHYAGKDQMAKVFTVLSKKIRDASSLNRPAG